MIEIFAVLLVVEAVADRFVAGAHAKRVAQESAKVLRKYGAFDALPADPPAGNELTPAEAAP